MTRTHMRGVFVSEAHADMEVAAMRPDRDTEDAHRELAAIVHASPDVVAVFRTDGFLKFLNAAARSVANLHRDDISDVPIDALYPAHVREHIRAKAMPAVMRTGCWEGESLIQRFDGSEIPVLKTIMAHRLSDGRIDRFSMLARDISDRKAYEARIAHLANFDALTDLPNKALLRDRISQEAAACRRAPDRRFALLVVNLDRFRLINDGFGPEMGDTLLRMIGERLRLAVREVDTVARLSSDLFALLVTDLLRTDDLTEVIRHVQSAIARPFLAEGREFRLTACVGAALFPRDGEEVSCLLRNAEAALHRAKAQGAAAFEFFAAEMTQEAAERVELENTLLVAAAAGGLQLHYQPQIALDSGMLVGLEALLRLRHPERGWQSAATFVPWAERTDLITTLDRWALAAACQQIGVWGESAAHLRIAVNVSARQFRSRQFAQQIEHTLSQTGVDPKRVELELTEGILMQDPCQAIEVLEDLRSLGVSIALDDFGTGYSSLSYLSRFPLDCIKIDRSFVERAVHDKYTAVIIESIISMAAALGLRVVAEGIQSDEQLALLRSLGCGEGQGFLFSAALPAQDVSHAWRHGNRRPAIALSRWPAPLTCVS